MRMYRFTDVAVRENRPHLDHLSGQVFTIDNDSADASEYVRFTCISDPEIELPKGDVALRRTLEEITGREKSDFVEDISNARNLHGSEEIAEWLHLQSIADDQRRAAERQIRPFLKLYGFKDDDTLEFIEFFDDYVLVDYICSYDGAKESYRIPLSVWFAADPAAMIEEEKLRKDQTARQKEIENIRAKLKWLESLE